MKNISDDLRGLNIKRSNEFKDVNEISNLAGHLKAIMCITRIHHAVVISWDSFFTLKTLLVPSQIVHLP
jgi:hypothetical protein